MLHCKQNGPASRMDSRVVPRRTSRKRLTLKVHIVLSLALASHAWLPAAAQAFYGSIVGRVSDKTGAVVTGAAVTITNLSTTEKHTITTDGSGSYRFVNLLSGPYRLEVES